MSGGLSGLINDVMGSNDGPGPAKMYGGDAGQSAHDWQQYNDQAAAYRNGKAPVADYGAANRTLGSAMGAYGQSQDARGSQSDALGLMQSAARGDQPSVAQVQMGQGISNAIRGQLTAASSARGGAYAQSAAQSQAAVQGSQMADQAVGQSAALRASEMASARDAYMGGASAIRSGDYQGMSGLSSIAQLQQQQGLSQAQLQAQQNALNLQGSLGYDQLAQNIDTANLNAATGNQALQAQANAQNSGQGMALVLGAMSAAGQAAKAAGDLHLKEPGGPDHWKLREEGDYILAMNMRTGEMRKLATQPLTPAEKREAMAPHGAGPLPGVGPHDKVAGDLTLADPQLVPARQSRQKSMADALRERFGPPVEPRAEVPEILLPGPAMSGHAVPEQLSDPRYQAVAPRGALERDADGVVRRYAPTVALAAAPARPGEPVFSPDAYGVLRAPPTVQADAGMKQLAAMRGQLVRGMDAGRGMQAARADMANPQQGIASLVPAQPAVSPPSIFDAVHADGARMTPELYDELRRRDANPQPPMQPYAPAQPADLPRGVQDAHAAGVKITPELYEMLRKRESQPQSSIQSYAPGDRIFGDLDLKKDDARAAGYRAGVAAAQDAAYVPYLQQAASVLAPVPSILQFPLQHGGGVPDSAPQYEQGYAPGRGQQATQTRAEAPAMMREYSPPPPSLPPPPTPAQSRAMGLRPGDQLAGDLDMTPAAPPPAVAPPTSSMGYGGFGNMAVAGLGPTGGVGDPGSNPMPTGGMTKSDAMKFLNGAGGMMQSFGSTAAAGMQVPPPMNMQQYMSPLGRR